MFPGRRMPCYAAEGTYRKGLAWLHGMSPFYDPFSKFLHINKVILKSESYQKNNSMFEINERKHVTPGRRKRSTSILVLQHQWTLFSEHSCIIRHGQQTERPREACYFSFPLEPQLWLQRHSFPTASSGKLWFINKEREN